jgi:Protein of unknown function (DUF2723)
MEPRLERWRPTPAAVAALLSGVALARMAAPTVTDRDAGELSAAAFNLDVAHPTGFVFDMVLFRLASLVPVGDVAMRMNLCVAALGTACCALAASLAWRLASDAPPLARWMCALAPAALMASSPTIVRGWTAVEVYAAAMFVALVCFELFARASKPAPRRRLLAALSGVAVFSLHTSARPAAALCLAVLTFEGARALDAKGLARRVAAVLVATLSTVTLVLWLPVASRRNGPVDWDDPESPRAVFAHLSAASIRVAYKGRMLVGWRLPEDLAHAGAIVWADLGPLCLALALAGLVRAARDPLARMLAVVGLIDLAYAVAVNPMGVSDRQTFFHFEACAALLAVTAAARIATHLAQTRARHAASLVAVALAVVALVRRDPAWAGAADGWSAPELLGGAGALGAVPSRALVLCGSDDLCGGSLYAQHVEGERPDVTVLPRPHLACPWTWRRLEARRFGERVAPLGRDDTDGARLARTTMLLERFGDRVRWEGSGEGESPAIRARWRFGSGETPALAAIDAPVSDVDTNAARWVRERIPSKPGAGARWVGATITFAAGSRLARADLLRGVPLWEATMQINPEHVSSRTNLAVVAARGGDLRRAVTLTRDALTLDPERPMAWRNLRDFLRALGDEEGARDADREFLRRRP